MDNANIFSCVSSVKLIACVNTCPRCNELFFFMRKPREILLFKQKEFAFNNKKKSHKIIQQHQYKYVRNIWNTDETLSLIEILHELRAAVCKHRS